MFKKNNEEKPYKVSNDLTILSWINAAIRKGYDFSLGFDDLQNIIDRLTLYYEAQYPDDMLDDDLQSNFDWVPTISNYLNAFSKNEKNFLKNKYRTMDRVIIGDKYFNTVSLINRSTKDKEVICFDGETGNLLKDYCTKFFDSEAEQINDLYFEIDKVQYDVSELEHCINNHEYDKILRRKILEIVVSNMINSKNTTKEAGAKRARIFIRDVESCLNDIIEENQIDRELTEDNSPKRRLFKIIKD